MENMEDKTSLDEWLRALDSADSSWRREACKRLGRYADPKAVEPLIRRLSDDDWLVRLAACQALIALGTVAVEPLIGRLQDGDGAARASACEALAGLGDVRAVEAIMAQLDFPDEQVRRAACKALGALGDARAVAQLVQRLGDKDTRVCQAAQAALMNLGRGDLAGAVERALAGKPTAFLELAKSASAGEDFILQWLINCLNDDSGDIRKSGCEALGRLHDNRVFNPILSLLRDKDAGVREAACTALGNIGDVRALDRLISVLADKESAVRSAACTALGKLRTAEAIEPLINVLGDPNRHVSEAAVKALVLINSSVLESLINRLGDPDFPRKAACRVLGQLDDPRAVRPLLTILDDQDSDVRVAACEALGQLGDERAVGPLVRMMGSGSSGARMAAGASLERMNKGRLARAVAWTIDGLSKGAEELGRLISEGEESARDTLYQALQDKSPQIRRAACIALGKAGEVQPIEPISQLLTDKDEQVRCAACQALGMLGGQSTLASLTKCLHDSSPSVRKSACSALAGLGGKGAVITLMTAVHHQDKDVREIACQGLGSLADTTAIEALINCLGDEEPAVREAAGVALGLLGEARLAGAVLQTLNGGPTGTAELAALSAEGDIRAFDPLLRRLEDWHYDIRERACEGLGQIGDSRAAAPMIERLADKSAEVRHAASSSLEKLGEGHLARAIAGLLDGKCEALSEIPHLLAKRDFRAVLPLQADLAHQAPCSRELICEALGRFGDIRATDALLTALSGKDKKVQSSARSALEAISESAAPRVRLFLCRSCMTRFDSRPTDKRLLRKGRYYACRTCGKAVNAVPDIRTAVAVLDSEWGKDETREKDQIRVNWLNYRKLFDFDRVEIVSASDEDVQRLCVQVGNDTDEFRRKKYKQVTVTVSPACRIEENTLRILKSMFAEVSRTACERSRTTPSDGSEKDVR